MGPIILCFLKIMSENLSEHSTTTPSDNEILKGFFFHSRYITKSVRNRYGLNTTAYINAPDQKKMCSLRTRLKEVLEDNKNINVESEKELHDLLGPDFSWVVYLNY